MSKRYLLRVCVLNVSDASPEIVREIGWEKGWWGRVVCAGVFAWG